MYHCLCCAFQYVTTANPRYISRAGMLMRPHAGAITGAATGKSVEADGTNGTTTPPRLPHRCRSISVIMRKITILVRLNNNTTSAPNITTTNLVKRYRRKIMSAMTTGMNRAISEEVKTGETKTKNAGRIAGSCTYFKDGGKEPTILISIRR